MTVEGCACKGVRETTPVNCSRFESGLIRLELTGGCLIYDPWVGNQSDPGAVEVMSQQQRRWANSKKKVYWHTYYCLRCRVQNSLKSSDQVTRQPWTLPPQFSKHLFWATASLCVPRWEVQELTVARRWRLWLYVVWRLLHRTDARIFLTASAENRGRRFCWTCDSKATKEGKAVTADRSWRFLLFPLPDHVYINYTASEANTMKKGSGSTLFYADEKQFGMRGEGGGSWSLRSR